MQEREIFISTSTILKVLAIGLGVVIVWYIRDILALIILGLFLAALIQPAADWGAKYKIPRSVMVLLVYLLVVGLAALVVVLMVPTILEQASKLATIFGQKWNVIQEITNNVRQFAESFNLTQWDFSNIQGQVVTSVKVLFQTITDLFGGLVSLIFVLVLAFYFVSQEHKALTIIQDIIPAKHQKFALKVVQAVQDKMGYWLRGQLLLSLIIGILYYIGLLIIGVDSALILAIFGGLTEFVPYLGPILGGIPIIFVAFVESPVKGILAIALLILVQQAENHLIVPKVMQKAVGLNPVISIVSMLIGATRFGILGALLAIPFATAVSVVIKEIREHWALTV